MVMESVYAGLTRQQQLLNHGPGDKKRPWSQSEDAARKALVDKPELAKKIIEAILAKRAAGVPEK
jgi:hypothetical protein